MRWEQLFADMEAQLHAAGQLDLEQQVTELARVEAAQTSLVEVLRASVGVRLSIAMRSGAIAHGELCRAHAQWLLLAEGTRSVLLPLGKVSRIQGMSDGRVEQASKITYTLTSALRILARNRAAVVIELDGARAANIHGVIDGVGVDFIRIMQLRDGVSRNRENIQGTVVIPIEAIESIASASENAL